MVLLQEVSFKTWYVLQFHYTDAMHLIPFSALEWIILLVWLKYDEQY